MDTKNNSDEPLTSSEIWGVLKGGWKIITVLTLLFGLAAAAVGFLMTPVYRNSTVLIAEQNKDSSGILSGALGQLGGLAAIAGLGGIGGTSQAATTEALAVLQSRQFIKEFIDKNSLMPKLYPEKWDSERKAWKSDLRKIPTDYRAYRLFTGGILDVSQDKKTNLITLNIDWTDRTEGAVWANELVGMINARMRERAIIETDETISYLQQELRGADTVEVRSAISSMLESQLKAKALAAVRKQYAFRVVDPAIPADEEFRLRPHKAIYGLIGLIVGFLLGIVGAFLNVSRQKRQINRA